MALQESVIIIPGGNPRKMPYTRDKQCNRFFDITYYVS